MTQRFNITLAQMNPVVGSMAGNRAKIQALRDDAPAGTDLVVFPEMALTGYPPEDLVLKPFFMAQVEQCVDMLVRDSQNAAPILLPTPWREDDRIYNAVLLIADGAIVAKRFKHNLPNYGVFDEARIFKAAPPPAPIEFRGHRLGVMICEDMWNGSATAALTELGAEMLIVVNASPFEQNKHKTRVEIARARVSESKLPLLYLNQCGGQDELVFDGGSFILDAQGEIICQAGLFTEETHHTVWRKDDDNIFHCETRHHAPAMEMSAIIYNALVMGLRDYVGKNGFPGVLIGLSGGIDSALSAAIAVDAFGADKVHGVMMPSAYTSQDSLDDAAELAQLLNMRIDNIPIKNAVDAFENELAPFFDDNTPSTTHENIQPRTRGLILMALSNASGKMVLSTGNKSEMAVGYATLYGDMCGGYNVLKDIYKTEVYELSRWRNAQGRVIPERIITKAPTAELKPNQTDQDSLPPYDVLDDILNCLIEEDMGVEAIANRGHDRGTIHRVWKMLDAAEYKRRQAPPGVKITSRAFGRDRRYPITNHFAKFIENQG